MDSEITNRQLAIKLALIAGGTSLAILAFYSLQIATPVGLVAGICISGGLSYAYLKPVKGPVMAALGSLVVVLVVIGLSTLLMVNLLSLPHQKIEY